MPTRGLAFFVLVFLAVVSQLGMAAAASKATTVHFKLRADTFIVLPVKINGFGPFDFVLDTGASATTIDSEFAAKLQLSLKESAAMMIVLDRSSAATQTAHVETLEVEGATVTALDLYIVSLQGLRSRIPEVVGILGEDFLNNFDLLLDNHRHTLQLERGPGPIAEALAGEHVPLSIQGLHRGEQTRNRLMLNLKIPDITPQPLRVQLDSAASLLIVFMPRPLSLTEDRWGEVSVENAISERTWMYERRVKMLVIGSSVVPQVLVMIPERYEESDADGLLPTNLFESIYVSHSGGFAIFNPARRTTFSKALP